MYSKLFCLFFLTTQSYKNLINLLQVINASKDAAASSSQLVTCIKLLGPTMASPLCQQQLMEAAKVNPTHPIIIHHLTALNLLLITYSKARRVCLTHYLVFALTHYLVSLSKTIHLLASGLMKMLNESLVTSA